MSAHTKEITIFKTVARDYVVINELCGREKNTSQKEILTELQQVTGEQYEFWAGILRARGESPEAYTPKKVGMYMMIRSVCGLYFTIRLLFNHREQCVKMYQEYCTTCTSEEERARIEYFIEKIVSLRERVSKDRSALFSNIILGFNDAIVELSGALVGFAFALKDQPLVVVGGVITGVSASLSMAASAYLQAKHESDKAPMKAALATGGAYMVVAASLITPFFFLTSFEALLGMLGVALTLITIVSFGSSVLLARSFLRQWSEILLLSLGIAGIAFLLGQALNLLIAS